MEWQQLENSSPAKLLAAIATLSFGLRRLDSLMLLTNVWLVPVCRATALALALGIDLSVRRTSLRFSTLVRLAGHTGGVSQRARAASLGRSTGLPK